MLAAKGYERYEISNYAKPGYECRHNLSYWDRVDYLGVGLGAASLLGTERKSNQTSLEEYLKGNFEGEREVLSEINAMEEYFFLGLRKMEGISVKEFEQSFEKNIESCYGENLNRMKETGLLVEEKGRLRLTERGIDISNYVFAEILG